MQMQMKYIKYANCDYFVYWLHFTFVKVAVVIYGDFGN